MNTDNSSFKSLKKKIKLASTLADLHRIERLADICYSHGQITSRQLYTLCDLVFVRMALISV